MKNALRTQPYQYVNHSEKFLSLNPSIIVCRRNVGGVINDNVVAEDSSEI